MEVITSYFGFQFQESAKTSVHSNRNTIVPVSTTAQQFKDTNVIFIKYKGYLRNHIFFVLGMLHKLKNPNLVTEKVH